MKYFKQIALLAALALTLTGCGTDGGSIRKVDNGSAVENAISEQMAAADTEGETEAPTEATEAPETAAPTETTAAPTEESTQAAKPIDVDYDLTKMDGDMVYATVYMMMVEPGSYIGKTVRMSGPFYPFTNVDGTVFYPACIIEDALACCAQGMEFVVTGTSYPDDYPEMGTVITVTGTFETYQEDGSTYCHLANAVLEAGS